ncbi:hypothetical protein [Sphingorhabdus pulchriflava]|jgi:hypothetical protein|uniref:hypothetical protein n=1 Tax=Sphingorhabdus pulchriflava TaxID=2292257 RepID=UPI001EF1243A|nr:hypothetical protein [Sphingorhabdus pulchriflava]
MARRPAKKIAEPTEPAEHRAVVVGWTHHGLGSSIDLRIQSTVSRQALDNDQVDSHHFLMTHNQALLLAKYLLDSTGQTLPQRVKPSIWRRFLPKRQK